MTLSIEHYIMIGTGIIIPLVMIIYKKKPKKNISVENLEIKIIKKTLKNLEDQVERDHIIIDDLRGKVAFIEGKLSK